MLRTFKRNYSPIAVVASVALLIALVGLDAMGQISGAAPSDRHAVVHLQPDADAHVQARKSHFWPRTPGGERDVAVRSEKNKVGTILLDQTLPLFLPAVDYRLTGKPPSSVAIADLNGDGQPDYREAHKLYPGQPVSFAIGELEAFLPTGANVNAVAYRALVADMLHHV